MFEIFSGTLTPSVARRLVILSNYHTPMDLPDLVYERAGQMDVESIPLQLMIDNRFRCVVYERSNDHQLLNGLWEYARDNNLRVGISTSFPINAFVGRTNEKFGTDFKIYPIDTYIAPDEIDILIAYAHTAYSVQLHATFPRMVAFTETQSLEKLHGELFGVRSELSGGSPMALNAIGIINNQPIVVNAPLS